MSSISKLLFFDLETTGVKYWKNGIHQISGKIVIDGEDKETFNFKVQPHPSAVIEQGALDVGGVTLEQIQAYTPMKDVYDVFVEILNKYVKKFDKKDKFHLVGYNNASFDNNFLRAFFVQNLDNYFGSYFWSDSFDVMVLASYCLRHDRKYLKDFKLSTVAKHLDIEVEEEKLHDALYDIELTQRIFEKVTR